MKVKFWKRITKWFQTKRNSKVDQYGLDLLSETFKQGDFKWAIRLPFKMVTLVNPKECENRVTVCKLVEAWGGTGHVEWEILLAGWFIMAVLSALKRNESEANISMLFDRDFYDKSRKMVFRQKEVYNHIMPWFDVVSENQKELKLRFKVEQLEKL